jgi:hypothetical protein
MYPVTIQVGLLSCITDPDLLDSNPDSGFSQRPFSTKTQIFYEQKLQLRSKILILRTRIN